VSPDLPFRNIWSDGACCAVAISGDVHDYEGIPGREDREFADMIYNMDLLRDLDLEGKATFYISAVIAERHPETIRQVVSRGYELSPHTYKDTSYTGEKWPYQKQLSDIALCHRTFNGVCPDTDIYKKGFRTHCYGSDSSTREALVELGVNYIADMAAWETRENLPPELENNGILYLGLPQTGYGYNNLPLQLVEIPDTVPNDHVFYRTWEYTPEKALAEWKRMFDRIYRLNGLFQTCLHPYISLKEEPAREKTYRDLLRYMQSFPGVVFMQMHDAADRFRKTDGLLI